MPTYWYKELEMDLSRVQLKEDTEHPEQSIPGSTYMTYSHFESQFGISSCYACLWRQSEYELSAFLLQVKP